VVLARFSCHGESQDDIIKLHIEWCIRFVQYDSSVLKTKTSEQAVEDLVPQSFDEVHLRTLQELNDEIRDLPIIGGTPKIVELGS
jgi:hypothetical protein